MAVSHGGHTRAFALPSDSRGLGVVFLLVNISQHLPENPQFALTFRPVEHGDFIRRIKATAFSFAKNLNVR